MNIKNRSPKRLSKEQVPDEHVFTPESDIRRPYALLREMFADLGRAQYIAWRLFVRDIQAQYRQTALGYIWAFLPPIALAVGMTLASNARILRVAGTSIPYPAYVIFGMVVWQTFTECATGPMQAISEARSMLVRVNFPREALVLAKLAGVLFNLAIKLILLAATFAWYGVALPWTAALAPLAVLALMMFGLFVGLALAPLAALYHDFSRGLTVLLGFWFFFTPIAYTPPSEGTFARIVALNPLTSLITLIREVTYVGAVAPGTDFWVITGLSTVGVLAAWLVYRISLPLVIERMSA